MEMSDFEEAMKVDIRISTSKFAADLAYTDSGDLATAAEESNLAQAILHRLRTGRGELSEIGYPQYGSDIYEILGESNDNLTKNKLFSILREALNQEPRIKKIRDIFIESSANYTDTLYIEVSVIPIEKNEPVKIAFPLKLGVI